MRRTFYILFFTLVTSNVGNAQYRVYYDNPILNGHYLSLGLFNADFKSLTSWNAHYEGYFGDGKFCVNADLSNWLNIQLLKKLAEKYSPDFVTEYDSLNSNKIQSEKILPKNFEIGGTYNFRQKMVRKKRNIYLFSYSEYSFMAETRVHVYARRQIKVYKFNGIRFGTGVLKTFYEGGLQPDMSNERYTVSPTPPGSNFFFLTRYVQNYMYLGISNNSIYNVKLSDLPYGGVRNSFETLYFDLVFQLSDRLEDVIDYQNATKYQVNLKDNSGYGRLGWRIGWRKQSVRFAGLGANLEVGKFSGAALSIFQSNYFDFGGKDYTKYFNYINVGISLSLTGPLMKQDISRKW